MLTEANVGSLELELQPFVRYPTRVLGTELGSPARTIQAPNCGVSLQPLEHALNNYFSPFLEIIILQKHAFKKGLEAR